MAAGSGSVARRTPRARLTRAHGRSRADSRGPHSPEPAGRSRPDTLRAAARSTTTFCARCLRPAAPLLEVDCQKSVGAEPLGNSCRK